MFTEISGRRQAMDRHFNVLMAMTLRALLGRTFTLRPTREPFTANGHVLTPALPKPHRQQHKQPVLLQAGIRDLAQLAVESRFYR